MKTGIKFYIGIDVSKPYFDASLLIDADHQKQGIKTERFNNSADGIRSFDKWLKNAQVSYDENTFIVVENTGIYHRLLWTFCTKKNLQLHIGNAAHIKWSFGIARGKNDTIDSIRLCNYAHKHCDELKAAPALNPVLLKLKDLMTSRTKLLTQVTAIKVYIKELNSVSDKQVQQLLIKAHKDAVKGLTASIKSIEVELRKIIGENEDIKKNYDLLSTVPGIGHLVSIYIICCTDNFAVKRTGKQLACYAGVVPFEHRSGISIKGRNRVHSMANKTLKKMLHLSAMTAIQKYPEFKQYYDRKKQEGKHGMSIMNAIRNKIILRAVAVVNNQKAYVNKTQAAA
jgi:transposase